MSRSRDDRVVRECVRGEAIRDLLRRRSGKGATRFSATHVPHRIVARGHNVVGKDEPEHLWIRHLVAQAEGAAIGVLEAGYVIDGNAVQRIVRPSIGDGKQTGSSDVFLADVIDD